MKNTSPKPKKIRCTNPGCLAWMQYQNSKPNHDVYVCSNQHVLKIPKGSMPVEPAA